MAGFPYARRHVNPQLREAVRKSALPGWLLASIAAIPHHSKFSHLICAESVPASQSNIAALERIAAAVGFPKGQLFLDGGAE